MVGVKKLFLFAAVFCLLAGFVLAAEPVNVSLDAPVKRVVLYSNNAAFVERSGSANLDAGVYRLKVFNFSYSAVFDSVFVRDLGGGSVKSLSKFYEEKEKATEVWALKELGELLNESLNRNIATSVTSGAGLTGKLAWFDDARIGIATSKGLSIVNLKDIIDLQLPGTVADKRVNETETIVERGVSILLNSNAASNRKIIVNYLVSGPSWSENFKYYIIGDVAKGSGELQAWASIYNGADEDWQNVSLTLVNGYPHFVSVRTPSYYGYAENRYYKAAAAPMAEAVSAAAPAIESTAAAVLGEAYWKYAFSEPVTVEDGETKNYPLFQKNVGFKREFKWDTSWSQPRRIYKLNNSQGESWSAGTMQVYLNGEFLGEDSISYTAAEKEADVYVADIPEVVVKQEQLNETTERQGKTRTTYSKYRLTIENKWSEDVELIINDQLQTYADEVRIKSSSTDYIVKPGRIAQWKPTIKKGKTATIDYEVESKQHDYY